MGEEFTEAREEIEKIKEILDPDERVLLVAKQSRIMPGGSLVTPNLIFTTDRRVILRNPTMLGLRSSVHSIYYENITGVELHKGVFTSEVRINAPGITSEISRFIPFIRAGVGGIPALPKDDAEKIVKIIREGMARAKAKPVAVTAPAISPLDELRKLKELLDAGAITKEEFEEKKKRLLEKV